MHPITDRARELVAADLNTFLEARSGQVLDFPGVGPRLATRLADYAGAGKLLRGAMVCLGHWLIEPDRDVPHSCVRAGTAMELLQSFFLIHDDIMDQDRLRRGLPAMHVQYESDQPDDGTGAHYGVSMAICVGDVAAFLACDAIAGLDVAAQLRSELMQQFVQEVLRVGAAQMLDVHHGYIKDVPTEAIELVYTYKTGRYTFSMPLSLGARIAGADAATVTKLGRFGELVGQVFQVRDDYIGIFGSADSGKPVGGDIREDKKTLFRSMLLQRLAPEDRLRKLFGAAEVSQDDIEQLRNAFVEHGVVRDVELQLDRLDQQSQEIIAELGFDQRAADALRAVLNYNRTRLT